MGLYSRGGERHNLKLEIYVFQKHWVADNPQDLLYSGNKQVQSFHLKFFCHDARGLHEEAGITQTVRPKYDITKYRHICPQAIWVDKTGGRICMVPPR